MKIFIFWCIQSKSEMFKINNQTSYAASKETTISHKPAQQVLESSD